LIATYTNKKGKLEINYTPCFLSLYYPGRLKNNELIAIIAKPPI
jgi:hypothetical protein